MRLSFLIIAVISSTILYRLTPQKPLYKFDYNISHSKSYHDSMMINVLANNKLIDSGSFKGKNGYIFFTSKEFGSNYYILIKEFGEKVNIFRVEELRNGRWMVIYYGNGVGISNIIKMKPKKSSPIRLHVVSASSLPYVSFAVYSSF